MADRRRIKQRKQVEQPKPTKEEYAIAKYLRFKIKTHEAKLHGVEVKYFIASDAVDALIASKWAKGHGQGDILLTTRASCVNQMNMLLQKGCFFHRAKKLEKQKIVESKSEGKGRKEIKDKEQGVDKKKSKERETAADISTPEEGSKRSKKSKEVKSTTEGDRVTNSKGEESPKTKEQSKKDEEKKKKTKKIRFQMHDVQLFKDGEEYYVWIYDPVSWKSFTIGLLLLLGVIAICLFPLWPPEVRIGISYISWLAIGLLGVIFALYIVRLIVFVCVWCLTYGKHHLWLLPNLNEDVGFWESFVPLYDHKVSEAKKDDENQNANDDNDTLKTEENKTSETEVSSSVKLSEQSLAGSKETEKINEGSIVQGNEEQDGSEQLDGSGDEQEGSGDDQEVNDSDNEENLHSAEHDDIDMDLNNDNGFELLEREDDDEGSDGESLPGDSDDDKKDK